MGRAALRPLAELRVIRILSARPKEARNLVG
jgi:hypothetical protein